MNEASQSGPSNKLQLSPTDTLAEAAYRSVEFFRDVMRRQHDAAVAGEIEPVHQLRVSSRRLRAAIELFAGVLYAGPLKIYRRDVPWIARQAGAVRNCDVLETLLKERAEKLDPALRNALGPLLDALSAERKASHAHLVRDLSSKRYANLAARLASPAIKTARGRAKLGIAAPELVAPMIRRARKKGKKLDDEAPAEIFHKLRVRIKRLRYVFEMLAALAGKRHRKTLARLEKLQELLGAYNDTNVAIAWLHAFAGDTNAPPVTMLAAGAMIHSLGSRARKLRTQCLKGWQRFERSEILDDAIGELWTTAKEMTEAERAAAQAARIEQAQADAVQAAAEEQPQSPSLESSAADAPTLTIVPEIAIAAPAAPTVAEGDSESKPGDDTEHAA